MKNLYVVLCVAILATSCKDSEPTTVAAPPLKSDSTFVMQPELPLQDTAVGDQPAPEPEKQKVTTTKKSPAKSTASRSQSQTAGNNAGTAQQDNSTTQADTQEPAPQAEEKKGWSKTAKGAVIGGVVGAGTGAIINKKNRAAGAVIGGVLGAGAGAVIGNQMDKKDGRH
jgi:hypothetical protein